ncbi:hypothetical protein FDECE_11968 [Fusarium decemcellulare]|nr:hypothetical protein FDECE_11968 [Fusarium decemcellulare]
MDKITADQAQPATVSTTSNNSGGYFSDVADKLTSSETTPVSTPGLKPEHVDTSAASKPVPALLREFPKPHDEVDVETMLHRQPGRWTIQGQMEANQRRNKAPHAEEEIKAQRMRDFEKAKEELRAFQGHLRTGSENWRP